MYPLWAKLSSSQRFMSIFLLRGAVRDTVGTRTEMCTTGLLIVLILQALSAVRSLAQTHRYIIHFNSNPKSALFWQMQTRLFNKREKKTKGRKPVCNHGSLWQERVTFIRESKWALFRVTVTACWSHLEYCTQKREPRVSVRSAAADG